MKNIEIEEELYQYIASQTQFIGESATSILRRLLLDNEGSVTGKLAQISPSNIHNIPADDELNKVASTSSFDKSAEEKIVNEEPLVASEIVSSEVESLGDDTNESVFNYLNKEELAMQRGAVGRFLLILGALYRVHTNTFSAVSDIRGRDRLYFSDNLNELTESGSSTKPFQIPESPYWVVTNSNTTRKKMILTKVAIALGYSEREAEDIRELL